MAAGRAGASSAFVGRLPEMRMIFFEEEDGIRDWSVTGVQTCALPICVTGMSGCWSAVGAPIAQGDDVFMVLPATLPEPELERRLKDADAAVVMKLGRHLPKIRRTLARVGRLQRPHYVGRGAPAPAVVGRPAQSRDGAALFSAVVRVPGGGDRG